MRYNIKNIKDIKIFKNIKLKDKLNTKDSAKNNIKNKNREIVLLLIITIIITLFVSGYSLGKEQSNINVNGETQIAQPICIIENNPAVDITAIKNTGKYDFKVKNYNEQGEITQVDLTYDIEILSKLDKTISFKLYKNEQEIKIENNKTENMILTKDIKQEDNYKLEIIYDKTKSNSIEDIIQEIQIKVHSEQLKA